ncbi:cyclin-like protein [Periconia macrospinosa]|uniref:Cyclin-like protein n=1 Tax=Periconia macrospinosa TaxID=97972 RepID=A0A2V1EH85_9PLEO|nr:cyclin-like protein [Periconia macrospinosa]
MAATASPAEAPAIAPAKDVRVGPHPSHIEVARPYVLQSAIQRALTNLGMSDAREDAARLQGVAYIDQVRRALQLPVRTFNTAVVYYHKFRLLHADHEYNYADAAAAALFSACKIEDTLKKSREILAAHYNLRVSVGEQVSSDDPRFEKHSRVILGLERLMHESAGFDFRTRHPQKLMIKIAKEMGFELDPIGKTAWDLSIDLYRTWAPLKQTAIGMAIACLELAAHLHGLDMSKVVDTGKAEYKSWGIDRAEVMEPLLDLLDLYTHYRSSTLVGPLYSLETFINLRIGLNEEASSKNIPRYCKGASELAGTNADSQTPGQNTNGASKTRNGLDVNSPFMPATPGQISPGTAAPPSAIGLRGQNGTVRFMLSAQRAKEETAIVNSYWQVEEEEYEEEVAIEPERERERDRDRGWEKNRDRDRDHDRGRDWDRDWEQDRRRVR